MKPMYVDNIIITTEILFTYISSSGMYFLGDAKAQEKSAIRTKIDEFIFRQYRN